MIYDRRIYTNHEVEQRSAKWFQMRLGKFTSSEIYNLFTPPTKEETELQALKECSEGKWAFKGSFNAYETKEITAAAKRLCIFDDELKEVKKALKDIGTTNKNVGQILDFCEAARNVHVFSKGAKTYILKKASDFIYFDVEETKITEDMWRGIRDEVYAKQAYIDKHKLTLKESLDVGFIDVGFGEDEDGMIYESGSSPDMFVRDDGLNEIKCLNRINHMKMVKDIHTESDLKEHKKEYYYQIHHQLWASNRHWGNLMSFDRTLLDHQTYSRLSSCYIPVYRSSVIDKQFEKLIPLAAKLRDEYSEQIVNQIRN